MSAAMASPDARPACDLISRETRKALLAHHAHLGRQHLRELLAADSRRGTRFTLEAALLHLDYSKNLIDAETLRLLVALAEDCDLPARTAAGTGERAQHSKRSPTRMRPAPGAFKGYPMSSPLRGPLLRSPSNAEAVAKFGIAPATVFLMWDWVGGRYSTPLGCRP